MKIETKSKFFVRASSDWQVVAVNARYKSLNITNFNLKYHFNTRIENKHFCLPFIRIKIALKCLEMK